MKTGLGQILSGGLGGWNIQPLPGEILSGLGQNNRVGRRARIARSWPDIAGSRPDIAGSWLDKARVLAEYNGRPVVEVVGPVLVAVEVMPKRAYDGSDGCGAGGGGRVEGGDGGGGGVGAGGGDGDGGGCRGGGGCSGGGGGADDHVPKETEVTRQTNLWMLYKPEIHLKREAAQSAYEVSKEKDRTIMSLEEIHFLAISTKDLSEDNAYWINVKNNKSRTNIIYVTISRILF
nr:hypothetical protein [Tanacetum cinerariifolium]